MMTGFVSTGAGALDFEQLKALAAGRPAPEDVVSLYQEAFARFGASVLWSRRARPNPTIGMALVVAEALRRDGDMRARAMAVRIEEASRAALALAE